MKLTSDIDIDALAEELAVATDGASGADLEYLCQTAARICVKDVLASGMLHDEVSITPSHFDEALSSIGYRAMEGVVDQGAIGKQRRPMGRGAKAISVIR